jgi:2',3'-cyclic-nucleotide 2'-phosphodiesterase (5'-nucleotidase family)
MLLVSSFTIFQSTGAFAKEARTETLSDEGEVTLLFTHDLHSHLDSFKVRTDEGKTIEVGGFARLKTAIDDVRTNNPATFVLDGGDFSMGTLYQTIFESDAPELVLLGRLGYDATTFGNHEFDYRSLGVSNMLKSAITQQEADKSLNLPQFLVSNIDWEKNNSEDNALVKEALEQYGAKEYTILERGGYRIGVYGVMGQEAEDYAPESGIDFDDIIEASKRIVPLLQDEGVDMIVCLSHSGTNPDPDKSEDELLAKAVPEIDVIISGHTHTLLEDYIQIGDTYIMSEGCYGQYLGTATLTPSESGRWSVVSYETKLLDESVAQDEEILSEIKNYKDKISNGYLKDFGYEFDQVLAVNDIAFTQMDSFGKELREDTLGSIIADGYYYAVKEAEGNDYVEVTASVAPMGTIRDTFQIGEVTVSDVFNVASLGIGADRIPGYPLVSVYLTGAELKTLAEIDASVSTLMSTAQLYPSGLSWTYNPNRLILNRVTDVKIAKDVPYDKNKELIEIDDEKLYRVVAGLYSAQMLGAVQNTSKGILKLTPKNEKGEPITDFEEYIIRDKNGNELKEWVALANYIASFEKNADGMPAFPEHYAAPEGRKIEVDSKNIGEIIKQPNKVALVIYAVGAALIAIIVFVILRIRRAIVKRRK